MPPRLGSGLPVSPPGVKRRCPRQPQRRPGRVWRQARSSWVLTTLVFRAFESYQSSISMTLSTIAGAVVEMPSKILHCGY